MAVCIISNANDTHAICVQLALEKKRVAVSNWHWGDFPQLDTLSVGIGTNGRVILPFLNTQVGEVALWLHRGFSPTCSPALHFADVNFVVNESLLMLHGILQELAREAFCVNPPEARMRLQSKINELSLAGKCGLTVPPTLFSNDPVAIKRFFHQHAGKVIVKHASQMRWESGSNHSVHLTATKKFAEHQLANEVQLSACPSIFQKEICKAFELRIVFMGATLFAIKIDSQKEKKSLDWRLDYRGAPPCSVFTLPAAIQNKVRLFIRGSGLRFGSIDMIVDTQGNYIFLEVNESGQFLWIEDMLPELPLLDCFAEFLISRDADFIYREGKCSVTCDDFKDAINMKSMKEIATKDAPVRDYSRQIE